MAVMREEMVDRLDASGRIVGVLPRSQAHLESAGLRVVHVFLFDARGRLLIHQLSDQKRFAGAWGSSVAGAVRAGEAPRKAARRELREELGIAGVRLRSLGRIRFSGDGITKHIFLYAAVHNGAPLRPDPKEISAFEFLPLDAIRDVVRHRERPFTPTFLSAFDAFERGVVG